MLIWVSIRGVWWTNWESQSINQLNFYSAPYKNGRRRTAVCSTRLRSTWLTSVHQSQTSQPTSFTVSHSTSLDYTSTFGRRAFSVAGPTVWNLLPDSLRDLALTSNSFRQSLKMNLFSATTQHSQCSRDAS